MTDKFPKITEEGLDDLRKRIGVKIENTVEPWNYEATRDAIRHYAHGIGDDNRLWCDPEYAATTKYGAHRRAAELPVHHQPDHFGLLRRPFGRPRDVGRRRLDLAQAGAAQRHDPHRGAPQGSGRASDQVRRALVPADLPRRFLQPARRHGRRGRQLGVPHRPRRSARARHQVHRSARPGRAVHRGAARGILRHLRQRGSPRRAPRATGKTSTSATSCRA